MAVGGILSSTLFQALQGGQNKVQNQQNEFQQLGQDLQSGNLAAAQQDFATLMQNAPAAAQGNNGNNTIGQALSALGQALQSGNLTAAQQDYATVQQDVQQAVGQTQGHHHHHHHGGGGGQPASSASSSASQQTNPIAQAFSTLGQALQSGNLTTAQQAYATLQQDFAAFTGGGTNTSQTTTGTLNVSA